MGRLAGKHIIIFYEDGTGQVSRKEGICSDETDIGLELDNKLIIPQKRIVRIEFVKIKNAGADNE